MSNTTTNTNTTTNMIRPTSIAITTTTTSRPNSNRNHHHPASDDTSTSHYSVGTNTSFSAVQSILSNSKVVKSSGKNNLLSGLNVTLLEEELSALEDSTSNYMDTNHHFGIATTTTSLTNNHNKQPYDSYKTNNNNRRHQQHQQQSGGTSSGLAVVVSAAASLIPARPRRLWSISDTKVPYYPTFYPRPSRPTSTYIMSQPDTPPSVIAIRISECLLVRSIVTDYDEEAVTATCFTIDRCLFVIRMWRIPSSSSSKMTSLPVVVVGSNDYILVECVRIKGNGFAFHRACRAILQAAQGLDSGKDKRCRIQSSITEYPRFVETNKVQDKDNNSGIESPMTTRSSSNLIPVSPNSFNTSILSSYGTNAPNPNPDWTIVPPLTSTKPTDVIAKVDEAMDRILLLLKKDRISPQIHGMEQLVSLTDTTSVGLDIALHASLCILGRAPIVQSTASNGPFSLFTFHPNHNNDNHNNNITTTSSSTSNNNNNTIAEIQKNWILEILINRRLPSELNIADDDIITNSNGTFTLTSLGTSLTEGGLNIPDHPKPTTTSPTTSNEQPTTTTMGLPPSTIPIVPLADDEDHAGIIRAMALRILCNSLSNLAQHQDIVLQSIITVQSPIWTSQPMISTLVEDIHKGCCRPVQAIHSTRLASQHEAALSCRILRIVCQYNTTIKNRLLTSQQQQHKNGSLLAAGGTGIPPILDYLEQARTIGKSTHIILAEEAHKTYQFLTEDDRSF